MTAIDLNRLNDEQRNAYARSLAERTKNLLPTERAIWDAIYWQLKILATPLATSTEDFS